MKFLCGAARAVITPPIGTCLYGYQPNWHSTSVHDDLTATAVALSGASDTVLLLSVTLGDIQNELCNELRQHISAVVNLPAANIILTATHTHCGPNTSGVEGWGEIDRPFVDNILIPGLKSAAGEAIANMRPAKIGTACGKSKTGINRRQQNPDGSIRLGQNPWGSYDPTMTVLCIRGLNGEGIVNLIHYGCHGTACGKGTEITRDWSGMMIDRVEKETGTLTAFINGAIGDVGPRLTNGRTTGNISLVEELGSYAAMDAMRILREVRSFSEPSLHVITDAVHLPYQPTLPLPTIHERLKHFENPDALFNVRRLEYQHLKDSEALWQQGRQKTPACFSFPQTLIALGDILFIPFPFELFSEISLRLRAYTGFQHTLCLSCANGYNGYLPTEDQLCRGGYEVAVFRYASVYSLADNTDQHIIDENLRILNRMLSENSAD